MADTTTGGLRCTCAGAYNTGRQRGARASSAYFEMREQLSKLVTDTNSNSVIRNVTPELDRLRE